MSIQSDIQSKLSNMPPTARRIGEMIISDPSVVLRQTISELANACSTSEPSVVRFCRGLGLSGYVELRIALATELGREAAAMADSQRFGGDLEKTDSLAGGVARIAFTETMAIEETLAALDLGVLEEVVKMIQGSRRVLVYGAGASGLVASDFQHKLFRIGRDAYTFPDSDDAVMAASLMTADDVAIGLSHSGDTPVTRAFIERARDGGAKCVVITNNDESKLAKLADISIRTVVRETMFRAGAFASRIAQLAVVDCIFLGVAQGNFDETVDALERTRDAVTRYH